MDDIQDFRSLCRSTVDKMSPSAPSIVWRLWRWFRGFQLSWNMNSRWPTWMTLLTLLYTTPPCPQLQMHRDAFSKETHWKNASHPMPWPLSDNPPGCMTPTLAITVLHDTRQQIYKLSKETCYSWWSVPNIFSSPKSVLTIQLQPARMRKTAQD